MANVVVWEWQNEYLQWRPYSPQISAFLEAQSSSTTLVRLGSVDPSLLFYSVDVQNSVQIRIDTGTQRPVRRRLLPSSNPLANGIIWQWEADMAGHWNDFDIDVSEYIDDCFVKNHTYVDLKASKFRLPYRLDLSQMTQTRNHTGRVRKIQRSMTNSLYPHDLSGAGAGTVTGVKRQTAATSTNNSFNTSVKRTRAATTQLLSQFAANVPLSTTASVSSGISSQTQAAFSQSVTQPQNYITPVFNNSVIHSVGSTNPLVCNNNSTSANSNLHQSLNYMLSGGPLTRRQYNQFKAFSSQYQQQPVSTGSSVTPAAPGSLQSTNFTPAVAHTQSNSSLPRTPQTQSSTFMGFNTVPAHSYQSGMPGMFSSSSVSAMMPGAVGLFGGAGSNPMFPAPGFTFQSAAGAASNTLNQLPTGNLNPAYLFSGSQSSRVRPVHGSGQSGGATGFTSNSSIPIKDYDMIPNFKHHKSKQGGHPKRVSSDEILKSYMTEENAPPENEDCCICYEKLMEASGHGNGTPEDHVLLRLEKCSHMYHKLCLVAMYDSGAQDGSLQCPACKTIYGKKTGVCPRGEMEYRKINASVPGYEGCRCIQIRYYIRGGIQGPEHPSPGRRYECMGFPRTGYLPDCDKGRKILQLLIVAWKRRLTFTIGTSATTSADNCVTWNEIHHKTELGSNTTGHGYPDPNYLDNVLNELAVHGITDKDISSDTSASSR